MKRALQLLGEPNDRTPAPPIRMRLAERFVSVADAHDGAAAKRFASYLQAAGATDAADESGDDLRIVIRSTPQSAEARLRADVMEEGADLILGSARASFAERLSAWARAPSRR
ncbi:MAG: hypothetical protein JRE43_03215 [Deltaproteobacteria bacterium]|nr:hypothetical protein [Deltaproteobacteria bacterium]MBW2507347.1 hypothetical protein [Deltaproteobacteria bacterium]